MENYKKLIQKTLEEYFEEYKKNSLYSAKIWEAMAYTTLLDGKRLRSIMALEIARMFDIKLEYVLPFACALEIMHAYSLIHDDLPCMDNDDLRRGKPSNHKVFGEGMAVLAGDALISFGAQIIIDKTPDAISFETKLKLVYDYLECAGAKGIIAGQTADIEAENIQNKGGEINMDNLKYIHKYKTGALFKLALTAPLKINIKDGSIISKISEYADNFGVLFQIYDDIIDCILTTKELGKTAGKDKSANKLTYVSAYGLEKAKNIFYSLVDKNYAILNELKIKSEIFDSICQSLIKKIDKG